MPENVRHGCAFGVSARRLHVIDGVQQVIAQWKSFFGDVAFRPDFELKVGILLFIKF